MCQYCEKRKEIRSGNFCGSGKIRIYNKGFGNDVGLLELQGDGTKAKIFKNLYCPRFVIYYCPMCGRKLGE